MQRCPLIHHALFGSRHAAFVIFSSATPSALEEGLRKLVSEVYVDNEILHAAPTAAERHAVLLATYSYTLPEDVDSYRIECHLKRRLAPHSIGVTYQAAFLAKDEAFRLFAEHFGERRVSDPFLLKGRSQAQLRTEHGTAYGTDYFFPLRSGETLRTASFGLEPVPHRPSPPHHAHA